MSRRVDFAVYKIPESLTDNTEVGRKGGGMNFRSEDIIEIRDPDIDAEAIMRQIRERIRARREEAEAQGIDIDHVWPGAMSEPALR